MQHPEAFVTGKTNLASHIKTSITTTYQNHADRFKLKPDYDASGQASDIDVLVLGGKYADGFRQAGFFSALLVGIIDDRMGIDEGNIKYLTLCKVNFNRDIEQVMRTTGFRKGEPS